MVGGRFYGVFDLVVMSGNGVYPRSWPCRVSMVGLDAQTRSPFDVSHPLRDCLKNRRSNGLDLPLLTSAVLIAYRLTRDIRSFGRFTVFYVLRRVALGSAGSRFFESIGAASGLSAGFCAQDHSSYKRILAI